MIKSVLMILRSASISLHQVPVFKNLYMDIFQQEITSLVYENDIEREAFVKLITGQAILDSGTFLFHQDPADTELLKQKVWVVGESPNLSRSLTLADHIFSFTYGRMHITAGKYERLLKDLFQTFHLSISPSTKIEELSTLQKLQIELLMAFAAKKDCVVLSNTSAVLSGWEIEELSICIKKLREYKVSFIILDNYENGLHRMSDRAYIIKSGHVINCMSANEIQSGALHEALNPSGTEPTLKNPKPIEPLDSPDVVFRFNHVCTNEFENLNLEIHKGEIIKFCYSDRYYARKFINIFQGAVTISKGHATYEGENFHVKNYEDALRQKIGFVPINPIGNMLFPELSVRTNLFYPVSRKAPEVLRHMRFQKSIQKVMEEDIPSKIYHTKVKHLNPLSQISIVYGKWYLYVPRLLICINPFPNYNIDMDQITQKWIRRLADRGTAVIIVASNWPSHIVLEGRTMYIDQGRIR